MDGQSEIVFTLILAIQPYFLARAILHVPPTVCVCVHIYEVCVCVCTYMKCVCVCAHI